MPEVSPDSRNRWYPVKWSGESQLQPAWAEKFFDTHSEAFDYADGAPRRPSHRPRPPAHPIPRSARRLGCLRGSRMTALLPHLAPDPLGPVMRLVLDAVSSASTRTMYGKALADF